MSPTNTRPTTPIRTISHNTFPLIIAQWEQNLSTSSQPRVEHWTFCILVSKHCTHNLGIRGNRDSFMYVPEMNSKIPMDSLQNYRGGCYVGNVPKDKIEELKERLRDVPVVRQEVKWDSTNWVLNALKILKEGGWVFSSIHEAIVRQELGDDLMRWNVVDDTVEERLLSELETGVPVHPAPVTHLPEEPTPTVPLTDPCSKTSTRIDITFF